MGEITIHLRANARTGERAVVVDYVSDPDLTHLEHETRHRQIVDQLVAQGVITRDDVDQVIFEPRAESAEQAQQDSSNAASEGAG